MAFQNGDLLAALRIPDAYVARSRHDALTIDAEGRHGDSSMSFKDGDLFATVCIPDTRRAVSGCRQHSLVVATEHRAPDPFRMSTEEAV